MRLPLGYVQPVQQRCHSFRAKMNGISEKVSKAVESKIRTQQEHLMTTKDETGTRVSFSSALQSKMEVNI